MYCTFCKQSIGDAIDDEEFNFCKLCVLLRVAT